MGIATFKRMKQQQLEKELMSVLFPQKDNPLRPLQRDGEETPVKRKIDEKKTKKTKPKRKYKTRKKTAKKSLKSVKKV